MTKKKDDENKDLTRIEDLSEFLHQNDSDLDSKFDSFHSNSFDNNDTSSTGISLDALDDDLSPDVPPEVPFDSGSNASEEMSFEVSELETETQEENIFGATEDNPFGDSEEQSQDFQEEGSFDTNLEEESPFESEVSEEFTPTEELSFAEEETTTIEEDFTPMESEAIQEETLRDESAYTNTSEKFEDVKTFAQNFSYGKASVGGGNPPYSIIARHIKYKEEADDILELLKEFGVVNTQNEKDTERSLELGSLIVPQISEYTAIILAHKLRRFDLDLEVGLSDEVHPSKSGESNPRGLLKKDNLKQNRAESLKLSDIDTSIKDIIVTTSSQVPGYVVANYIGVQTTFTIVEEAELERLQYVQKNQRDSGEILNMEDLENPELTSEKAFKDYQNSFALLYEDLTMQLKQKAYAQHANALLGLNFQLSPLQFERSHGRVNAYQITCSATLAIVGPETT